MSTINGLLYKHPLVWSAIDEACDVVDSFLEGLDADERDVVMSVVCAWTRVELVERIAAALLARVGIGDEDLDLFEEIYDEHCCNGTSDAAMLELWDAQRRKEAT